MSTLPHTVPTTEFYFREKKYRPPVSTIGAIGLSAFAGLAYSIWVEHCAAHNGTCEYSSSGYNWSGSFSVLDFFFSDADKKMLKLTHVMIWLYLALHGQTAQSLTHS